MSWYFYGRELSLPCWIRAIASRVLLSLPRSPAKKAGEKRLGRPSVILRDFQISRVFSSEFRSPICVIISPNSECWKNPRSTWL